MPFVLQVSPSTAQSVRDCSKERGSPGLATKAHSWPIWLWPGQCPVLSCFAEGALCLTPLAWVAQGGGEWVPRGYLTTLWLAAGLRPEPAALQENSKNSYHGISGLQEPSRDYWAWLLPSRCWARTQESCWAQPLALLLAGCWLQVLCLVGNFLC